MKKIIICVISIICACAIAYAQETRYIRGQILYFIDDPDKVPVDKSYQYIYDGLLIIEDGKIKQAGEWANLQRKLPKDAVVKRYENGLIVPGFIDTHIHYPQLDMIAANSGGDLLQWLNTYTFPFEEKFNNETYSQNVADFFLDELLRNGTTTAMIFTTIYPKAIDSLFSAAQARHMRIITGLVMGDNNLPPHLIQNINQAVQETKDLIDAWHKKPGTRLLYSLQFRFAPTTSVDLFGKLSALRKAYPDTYVHTHISENKKETEWSKSLFKADSYLDIYDNYQLLGEKTILAHGVYLTDKEEQRMSETGTAVSFCPTSNLFLGSGLFDIDKARTNRIHVGLGTDVGAGTSFSMLQVMNEAYKVAQMQSQKFSALKAFYMATLGAMRESCVWRV